MSAPIFGSALPGTPGKVKTTVQKINRLIIFSPNYIIRCRHLESSHRFVIVASNAKNCHHCPIEGVEVTRSWSFITRQHLILIRLESSESEMRFASPGCFGGSIGGHTPLLLCWPLSPVYLVFFGHQIGPRLRRVV